jgi:SRSO17 transposase
LSGSLVVLSQKILVYRLENQIFMEIHSQRRAAMDLEGTADSASRFAAFVGELVSMIGHADRARPLRDYCTGLLASEGRRSVEPIAAVTAPAEVSVQHQRLLHFVADAPWPDEPVLAKVRKMVVPAMERHGPIEAWIVDDTSFPKCGSKSVGVHHQYCGQLGKQANCQVVVTLSIANHHASLPIAYRLYLPQEWAEDAARRKKARVPKAIAFKTKPEIALKQIQAACAAGVPRGAVLTDASYGSNSKFRAGISALGLKYVAAIVPTVKVRRVSDRGAPEPRLSAKQLALSLPKHAWRTITWREGTNERLCSRFARVPVRTAPIRGAAARGEETLLIEWPVGQPEPTKYWLATVDKNISFRALVDLAKMPLAGRARLPGAQARNRARALRGARLAGLPPSRYTLHRSLWVPDLRTGVDSPLRTSLRQETQKTCHSQWLPTSRRRRSGPNVTSPTRSRHSINA